MGKIRIESENTEIKPEVVISITPEVFNQTDDCINLMRYIFESVKELSSIRLEPPYIILKVIEGFDSKTVIDQLATIEELGEVRLA